MQLRLNSPDACMRLVDHTTRPSVLLFDGCPAVSVAEQTAVTEQPRHAILQSSVGSKELSWCSLHSWYSYCVMLSGLVAACLFGGPKAFLAWQHALHPCSSQQQDKSIGDAV